MEFVNTAEGFMAWRDYVARRYATEPAVAAILQLLAAESDRDTWEIKVTQSMLCKRYGMNPGTTCRWWHRAIDTGLVHVTDICFDVAKDFRNAGTRIILMVKTPEL
jgi:hypothetical protein